MFHGSFLCGSSVVLVAVAAVAGSVGGRGAVAGAAS